MWCPCSLIFHVSSPKLLKWISLHFLLLKLQEECYFGPQLPPRLSGSILWRFIRNIIRMLCWTCPLSEVCSTHMMLLRAWPARESTGCDCSAWFIITVYRTVTSIIFWRSWVHSPLLISKEGTVCQYNDNQSHDDSWAAMEMSWTVVTCRNATEFITWRHTDG